jgi:type 1 fimbriae regulatory protein FimB
MKSASINHNRSRRERSREYLTGPEIKKFLEAAKTATRNSARDYCMMLLTYQHGLRVSELTGLTIADVDLVEKTININRLKNSISGRHPLFTGEAKAIRDWLAVREAMEPETNALFISEQRRPLSRATVDLLVGKIALAAGLGDLSVHAHMLRHSAGYSLINRGFDVRTVQVHLGHARLENTARYTALDHTRLKNLF